MIDGNQIVQRVTGESSGAAEPEAARAVVASYENAFVWEMAAAGGLRAPQLGALHATLGYWTTAPAEPATVVMPTGTGKTDTMVSLLVAAAIPRLLVVVPTDPLRDQLTERFMRLGVLPERSVVRPSARLPVVGRVRHGFTSTEAAADFAGRCNVIVATPAALSASSEEIRQALFTACTHLFVDEAHHIPARSWNRIRDAFSNKPIVQFTATPFRRDGRRLGGRSLYTFPLREAQRLGYYATIDYIPIRSGLDPDRAVASAAIARLRTDLEAGHDHLLMARARDIPSATVLHWLYAELAPDLNPQLLHSRIGVTVRRAAHLALRHRHSRIVVCVDMLGEGFDLPELKVAALHDVHRSLGVTLQFVGRFARTSDTVGTATVVAPRPDGELDQNLRRLYQEDADWNLLIRDLGEEQLVQQQEIEDFERGFVASGNALSVRNALPKMSAVVYRTTCAEWNPSQLATLFPPERLLTGEFMLNPDWHVLWFVTEDRTPIYWEGLTTVDDVAHELYVFYWDQARGLLYINCSANEGHYETEAKALCGDDVELIRGNEVFRAMARLDRRVPTNVGLLDSRSQWRRFSTHAGADVSEGFPTAEAQTKTQTNIFAIGYENGERTSVGGSRKGRIWSYRTAPTMKHWVDWCDHIGGKLTDDTISVDSILASFIRPEVLQKWPDLVPLGAEWPAELLQAGIDGPVIELGDDRVPFALAELAIVEYAPGPPLVAVRTPEWEAQYRVDIDGNGMTVTPVGDDPTVLRPRSAAKLSSWLNRRGFRILLEDDAVIEPPGLLLRPPREVPPIDSEILIPTDWTGINIRRESRGTERDSATVQARALEAIMAEEWDVVVDDDGSGEIADIVALRTAGGNLTVRLVHCKYSSEDQPGSRVADFYELCGQAQKSARYRGNLRVMIERLISRERQRLTRGAPSGLERGSLDDLYQLRDDVTRYRPELEITVVQPGLSKSGASLPVLHLLGCTETYVREVANAVFEVHCSR